MVLDDWPKFLEKNLFYVKEDFFQIPFLFNSPSMMLESLFRFPLTKHNEKEGELYLESAVLKEKINYRRVEKDLWIFTSDSNFLHNVESRMLFDSSIPCEYYILTFYLLENKIHCKNAEDIFLSNSYWTLSFPGTEVSTFYFKETKGSIYSLMFTKNWVHKNLTSRKIKKKESVFDFLDRERGFYTGFDGIFDSFRILEKIRSLLEEPAAAGLKAGLLKKKMDKVLIGFFERSIVDSRFQDQVPLSSADYHRTACAEKIILKNLRYPFRGIENIAREVSMSPTKLKVNFKTVFGFSMLQYHKERNLLLGLQFIEKTQISIQDIAVLTGQESAGRFAAAFKKRFGVLPSEARNEILKMSFFIKK